MSLIPYRFKREQVDAKFLAPPESPDACKANYYRPDATAYTALVSFPDLHSVGELT
ncbi:hypothetical protein D9M68_952570 [compost metagenome]